MSMYRAWNQYDYFLSVSFHLYECSLHISIYNFLIHTYTISLQSFTSIAMPERVGVSIFLVLFYLFIWFLIYLNFSSQKSKVVCLCQCGISFSFICFVFHLFIYKILNVNLLSFSPFFFSNVTSECVPSMVYLCVNAHLFAQHWLQSQSLQ